MGLLALFDFLDTNGSATAQDSAGAPQNATFYGDATTDGAGTATFDGDDDYAVVDPDPAFDLSQGTIELSFTLNSTSPGNSPFGNSAAYTIFSSDAKGTMDGHINVFVTNSGTIAIRHQTDGQHHYYTGGNAAVGSEVDVSYSFGPTGSVLVVNGVTVDTGTQAHTMAGGTNPIVIGASTAKASPGTANTTEGHLDGTISRVAIYDDQTGSRGAPACVVSATSIATLAGPCPAGSLQPGMLLPTLDNGPVAIVHVMRQTVHLARLATEPTFRPIKIAAGALGNATPLTVSRQHCLLMDLDGRQVLIRAGHLAEFGPGRFRRADGARVVTYVHLLLTRHELIRAEGCWVESLRPESPVVPMRLRRQAPPPEAGPCRPILASGEVRRALQQGRLKALDPLPLAS
ncbi:MAG: Hint domain-containing protein [Pseudomonadota bacterium]